MGNIIHLDKYPEKKLAEKRENIRKENLSIYRKESKVVDIEDSFPKDEVDCSGDEVSPPKDLSWQIKKGFVRALDSFKVGEPKEYTMQDGVK